MAEAVHQRFRNIRNDGKTANHVSVEGAVAYAQFTFVSGAENDCTKLIGKRHEHGPPGSGLNVLFGFIFLVTGKHILQSLSIALENFGNWQDFEADAEILGEASSVVDGTRGRVRAGHADPNHVFATHSVRGNDRGKGGIDSTAQSHDDSLKSAFLDIISRSQNEGGIDVGFFTQNLIVDVAGEFVGIEVNEVFFK